MSKSYILSAKDLEKFVDELAKGKVLFGPVEEEGATFFKKVRGLSEITIPEVNTTSPAKESRLPRDTPLMKLVWEDNNIKPKDPKEFSERVFFGVRPCDAAQNQLLDAVFLDEPVDDFYQKQKEKLLTIALACDNPGYYCFCDKVGIGPHSRLGADIYLVKINDSYLVEGVNEKGEKSLENVKKLLKKATEKDMDLEKSNEKSALKKFTQNPLIDKDLPKKMLDKWDHPIWEENGAKCIGCGICTFLCPTCYCFELADDFNELADIGERIRCWDACTMPSFTKMAGGHNPRDTQTKRLRQRIQHKFNYIPERYGFFGCTGCGRCTQKCPVDVNLVEILEEVGK
ncbi:MAG: 4Fe-4S dicluster domain-containing protein [Candidatus Altiarchaeota archaeon]